MREVNLTQHYIYEVHEYKQGYTACNTHAASNAENDFWQVFMCTAGKMRVAKHVACGMEGAGRIRHTQPLHVSSSMSP